MNQREQPSAPRGALALPCLAMLLLPILAVSPAKGGPGLACQLPAQRTYLAIVGAPPLRFLDAPLPPAPVPHPIAVEASAASTSARISDPASDVSLLPASSTAASPLAHTTGEASADTPSPPAEPTASQTPAPIIPDEMHPRVHAEDFLPYFRIPIAQPDDMNVVPVPRSPASGAPLPSSSATYTQTPR